MTKGKQEEFTPLLRLLRYFSVELSLSGKTSRLWVSSLTYCYRFEFIPYIQSEGASYQGEKKNWLRASMWHEGKNAIGFAHTSPEAHKCAHRHECGGARFSEKQSRKGTPEMCCFATRSPRPLPPKLQVCSEVRSSFLPKKLRG